MAKNITISVHDTLKRAIEECGAHIEVSAVCSRALAAEVARIEEKKRDNVALLSYMAALHVGHTDDVARAWDALSPTARATIERIADEQRKQHGDQ